LLNIVSSESGWMRRIVNCCSISFGPHVGCCYPVIVVLTSRIWIQKPRTDKHFEAVAWRGGRTGR